MIYSWQQELFQQLWMAHQRQRLAHAYLFTGVAGDGKYAFAEHFIQALLCEKVSEQGIPCGDCHACRLVKAHAHPDYLLVTPEQAGHAIKVDQIRAVNDFVQQSSVQGGYRFVLIDPAHNMNISAANALLKTLEEPAAGAIMILLSDQHGLLPATIRSRCQRLIFPFANLVESDADTLAWRQTLFDGLIAIAKAAKNPLQLAADLPEKESATLLSYFTSWLVDLLRLQLFNSSQVVNNDYLSQLQELVTRSRPQPYLQLMQEIEQVRQQINTGINFNKLLLLERLLIRWRECASCS